MGKINHIHLLQKMKKLLLYSAVGLVSLGLVATIPNSFIPQSVTTVAASPVAVTSGSWGGATWTIDGAALTLSGGNIGTPPRGGTTEQGLAGTLKLAGVDPSTITSITIANKMSASNVGFAFAFFDKLQSITGLGNLSYSGSAYCMFEGNSALSSMDISEFDTSQINNMGFMFAFNRSLTSLDLSNFDTSNVGYMYGMFDGLTGLTSLDVSSFDTSKVDNMTYMFVGCSKLKSLDLRRFDTSKVGGMSGMFAGCPALTSIYLSSFNTEKVTSMSNMFAGDSGLTELDLYNFYIDADTDSYNMFGGMNHVSKLRLGYDVKLNPNMNLPEVPSTGGYAGKWQNVGSGMTSDPLGDQIWTSKQLMSNYTGSQDYGNIYVWMPTDDNRNISGKWGGATWTINDGVLTLSGGDIGTPPEGLSWAVRAACVDPSTVTSIHIANKMSAKDIESAFACFENLESITGMANLSYSGSARCMFKNNYYSTSLDLSEFNTSEITDMGGMFDCDESLTSLNLSNFDTSKVVNMDCMFSGLSSLTSLDLSNFDTSNVENMYDMFYYMSSLTNLNLSSFDTSKVESMDSMFRYLSSLTSLDLSSFDTSKAVEMSETGGMFDEMTHLNQLTLGKNFKTTLDMDLPEVPTTDGYTGKWQNLGTGSHIWTSEELLANYLGGEQAETFVWQNTNVSIASITDKKTYETAWPYASYPFSSYGLAPVQPKNPYHYRVVINNDYDYYSDLVVGDLLSSSLVSLPDNSWMTVYCRGTETMTDSMGLSASYANISFGDGNWYWVDERALNTGKADTGSIVDQSRQFTSENISFPLYFIVNSFNPSGQIIWSDNGSAYASQMRAAAAVWNQALGMTVFVENTGQYSDEQVTLKLKDQAFGADSSIAASYNLGGALIINTDQLSTAEGDNDTILVLEHELGHAMGLAHTMNYYGSNFTSDIMTGHIMGGNQAPTANEIQAVKLIIANHDFTNPWPMKNPNF